jgi:hypothetical protein
MDEELYEECEVVDAACFDRAREQWELIREVWNELELEDVLARDWARDKRWLLDRLLDRMRALDRFYEEHELAAALAALKEGGDERRIQ